MTWTLMLCQQMWHQTPKVSFAAGLSIGNPELIERRVRETKMSITGEHMGFEDMSWVRSPKEKSGEKGVRTDASAWKRTIEDDMLWKP